VSYELSQELQADVEAAVVVARARGSLLGFIGHDAQAHTKKARDTGRLLNQLASCADPSQEPGAEGAPLGARPVREQRGEQSMSRLCGGGGAIGRLRGRYEAVALGDGGQEWL
jgi:hypothetical protein